MRDYWCLEIKHKSFSHVSVILWQCLHLTQISHFESQFFALLLFLKDSLLFKLQLFFSFFFFLPPYFGSLISHSHFFTLRFRLAGRQAAVVQRIVLEPAVLLKSFQTPFTIRYSQRKKKAPPLTSSHLSDLKKKKKNPLSREFWPSSHPLLQLCPLHTHTITRSDTVAALYNCLLLLSATRLFPLSKVGFRILLKGTSTEDVKGAESLSHSISPHRFSQLLWDWKRRPCRNKLTAEPPGHSRPHCTTVPRLWLQGSREGRHLVCV